MKQAKEIKRYRLLERWAKLSHQASLFLSAGLVCFFMALMCLPVSLYNNPKASQNLFNLIKFQPMFRYLFFGFLIAGIILVIIAGFIYSRREDIQALATIISPEDRVRAENERDEDK